MPSPGIRGLNNYRFNGKEFQADLGLNWTQLDWRMVDTQRGGGFHVVDPEIENGQESMSPYVFGFDNAVRYNDPNGRYPGPGGGPGSPAIQVEVPLSELAPVLDEAVTLVQAGAAAIGLAALGSWVADHLPSVETLKESFKAGAAASGPFPGMVPNFQQGPYPTHTANGRVNASSSQATPQASNKAKGTYSHPESQNPLPKKPTNQGGTPEPDPDAAGKPHTRLGRQQGSKGAYNQAREFDKNGKAVKDIDFTDHGRPANHTNPHQHSYIPNPTGGTPRRDDQQPLN